MLINDNVTRSSLEVDPNFVIVQMRAIQEVVSTLASWFKFMATENRDWWTKATEKCTSQTCVEHREIVSIERKVFPLFFWTTSFNTL